VRVITLWQPWATLIALGEKRIETRAFGTRYRGPLAIHAAQKFPHEARHYCTTYAPFRTVLGAHGIGIDDLPIGRILCLTNLVDVIPTDGFEVVEAQHAAIDAGALFEPSFGDYRPGRRAWILDGKPQVLPIPIPWRGAQGLRDLPTEIADLIRSELARLAPPAPSL